MLESVRNGRQNRRSLLSSMPSVNSEVKSSSQVDQIDEVQTDGDKDKRPFRMTKRSSMRQTEPNPENKQSGKQNKVSSLLFGARINETTTFLNRYARII